MKLLARQEIVNRYMYMKVIKACMLSLSSTEQTSVRNFTGANDTFMY